MAQQTAVSWLIEQLEVFVTIDEELTWDKMFDKAKAMEKEREVNFCFECLRGDNIHTIKSNKELLEYIVGESHLTLLNKPNKWRRSR